MFGNKDKEIGNLRQELDRKEAHLRSLETQLETERAISTAHRERENKEFRERRDAEAKIEAEKRAARRARAEVAAEWLADVASGKVKVAPGNPRIVISIFLCKSVLGWGKVAPEFKPVEYSQSIRIWQNQIYGALMGNIFGR